MSLEAVCGCAVASAAGYPLFAPLASRRRNPDALRDSSDTWKVLLIQIRSSVLGTYLISMTLQAVVYPLIVAYAWLCWPSDNSSWLLRRGDLFSDASLTGLRFFLYTFFAYLLNDLPMSWGNPLIRLHHVICLLGILVALNTPEGCVPVVLGMFVVEYGSLFYNAWLIDETVRKLQIFPWWPQSRNTIDWAYRCGMTVSNLVGGYMLFEAVRINRMFGHGLFSAFYATCGSPLLFLRQKEMFAAQKPPGVTAQ
mmetsp:Transcript_8408/g.19873  ORF Transcript_8408/g.19873 Transcript_8408/m.19873 type:complete len:253 (-) Transcript_8408:334-1092(-)